MISQNKCSLFSNISKFFFSLCYELVFTMFKFKKHLTRFSQGMVPLNLVLIV